MRAPSFFALAAGFAFTALPDLVAQPGCVTQNFNMTNRGLRGSAGQFGILANSGAAARAVSSVDLFVNSNGAPLTVNISIWTRATTGSMAPGRMLGSGSAMVGSTLAVYNFPIIPTVPFPANTDFFIVLDNPVSGQIALPIASSGMNATHYFKPSSATAWNGPFASVAWAFRINCGGGGCQSRAAYTTYGQGCPGTGSSPPRCNWIPIAFANAFGNSNNVIPFTWTPINYQQVFDGSNFPNVIPAVSLSLRQDQQFGNRTGGTVDIEVNMGRTSFTAATLTNTFASNFNMGPKTNVFPRNMAFVLPNSGPPPTNPNTTLFTIPFTTPFPVIPNMNVLVEVLQRGNSRGNAIFTYPLDADRSNTTQTRLFGTGATGTLGRNFGVIMCLNQPGSQGAVPQLSNTGLPGLGGNYSVDLSQALANTPALLLHGHMQANIDLTGIGGPGCTLLTQNFFATEVVTTSATGTGSLPQSIPNDQNLCGAKIYQQYFVFDPTANALQFVGTRGGDATLGL